MSLIFLFILCIGLILIFYAFYENKVAKFKKDKKLSYDEKKFYVDLYSSLPTGFCLTFQTEAKYLTDLINKNKKNNPSYKYFKSRLRRIPVDFVVLDDDLQACCVILLDKKTYQHELVSILNKLEVPIFIYESKPSCDKNCYNFDGLISYLNNKYGEM